MPLQRCGDDGKSWRWGEQGKCYPGPEGKKQALRQGYAENGGNEKKFQQELKASASELDTMDLMLVKRLMAESSKKKLPNFLTAVAKEFDKMDVTKAYIPEHERDKIPEEDFAGPGRSFPIRNEIDVHNAAHLIGHGKDPSAIKRKIIEIAKRKGLSLPDAWR